MAHSYSAEPSGYTGDEDQGQMGSYFVLMAMGLFEMDDGCSQKPIYEIGSPLFGRIVVHLDKKYYPGRQFVIEAKNNSPENVHIQSATLNGKPLNQPWIYHSDVMKGARLVVTTGFEPNTNWGPAPEASPRKTNPEVSESAQTIRTPDLSLRTKFLSVQISRRTLAKALAASGTTAGLSRLIHAESPVLDSLTTHDWKQVHPGVWRTTIGTPERFTPVSNRLVPPQTEAFAKLPRVDAGPLPPIEGKQTARGCLIQLPLRPDEQIFGFGLQFQSFAQRGKKKVARVNADPTVDTGDSHAPVPFYVTTEGIGILIDTARYATFYFGDARPKPTETAPVIAGSSLDPNYAHTVAEGDNGRIIVEVPRTSGVDVYLFSGPEMQDAVKRYNVFSGGGFVPPEWGLGFWYRTAARANHEDVLAIAQELRDRKIPCDAVGLEPGWQSHAYSCTFVWDQDRFPNPNGFIKSATDLHYKINLWEHAFTNPASPLFSAIEPYSGNFGVWNGLVPDFAGAPAREAFGSYHGKNLIDMGVSAFKLDECDNSDFTHGWSFPECSSFPSGVDGEQMHNVFGLRYQMVIWDQFRKRNKETYGLVRSSGALATPYPFVLYSDLYDHRVYIRALVNSGFSGLLWCPEVRQADSMEDLIRRLQSVVFSPLAQIDCWYMKNPPWKQTNRALNNNDHFFDQWQMLESRCREIIGWRMQLSSSQSWFASVIECISVSTTHRADDRNST